MEKDGHNINIYDFKIKNVISCNNISPFLTSLLEGGDGGRLYHSAKFMIF